MRQVLCGDARTIVTNNEARMIALQPGGDENDDRDGADGPRRHQPSVGKAEYQHDAAYEGQTPGKLPRMRQLALNGGADDGTTSTAGEEHPSSTLTLRK